MNVIVRGGVPLRIWFKVVKDTRITHSEIIEDYREDTRTHKIFAALEEACVMLDLGRPIWLDANITEFKRRSRTRFRQDNFVEKIDFDYLEMAVLEED